jgi:HK97 family phage major capsid protein
MFENKISVMQLIQQRESLLKKREDVNKSMNAIIDEAKANKRELSAEENVKYQQLQSEFDTLSREIAINVDMTNFATANPVKEKTKSEMLRECLKGGVQREYVLAREAMTTTDIEAGGMVPLTIKDVIPPLEMGLIFDKVGIQVQTGVKGNIQWPALGAIEASIVGEAVAVNETKIDLSKINAKHVRLSLKAKVSNQAINDSYSDLIGIVKGQIQAGLRRTLNRVTFSHEDFTSDLHGPFAGAKASGTFAGSVPTYKEWLAMKGKVAASGVDMFCFCYIMSESMKAILEATPVDAGSGRMIVENDKVAGYPVYCTEYINYGKDKTKAGEEYIGAGVWAYLAANQHGDVRMIVDPYTAAGEDSVVVTLNSDWSLTTLEKSAFALYKTAAA